MGIVNRTKDLSEQLERIYIPIVPSIGASPGVPSGSTFSQIIPYPCVLQEAQIFASGVSGSPTFNVSLNRFIPGTGFTVWTLCTGASNIPAAFGTSGVGSFGASVFGSSGMLLTNAAGSTLNILAANDVIAVTVAGGSSASCGAGQVALVLKPTQDIKKNFGFSV